MANNKEKLQTHNSELEEILSTVTAMPNVDEVKNGQYIWKKYSIVEAVPDKNIVCTQTAFYPMKLKLSSSDIDVTKLTTTSFEGLVVNNNSSIASIKISFNANGSAQVNSSGSYTYSYDASAQELQISYNLGSVTYTWDNIVIKGVEEEHNFMEYVVADSNNKYPEEGRQDRYWYELVKPFLFGLTVEKHGTFTVSSDIGAFILEHNLGVRPKLVIVYTNDSLKGSQYMTRARIYVDRMSYNSTTTDNSLAVAELYQSSSYSSFETFSTSSDTIPMAQFDENSMPLRVTSSNYWKAGVTYYWQVIA